MSQSVTRWLLSCVVALAAGLSGCASEPKQATAPGPLDEPIDAFEAVGAPQRPGGAPQSDRDNLSQDIERLQNARDTYEHEQERLTVETQRSQAECRERPDTRKVAINDGSSDPNAVYCEPASDSDANADE